MKFLEAKKYEEVSNSPSYVFELALFVFLVLVLRYLFYLYLYDWNHYLVDSCRKGDISFAHEALRNKADVNYQNSEHESPLIVACSHHHLEILKMLLEVENCKLQLYDTNGKTALAIAVEHGYLEAVKLLVEKEEDMIETTSKDGSSPLIIASCEGHLHVVDYLMKRGANVNWKNQYGINALQAAVSKHHTKDDSARILIMEKLLFAGTDIESKTSIGWTALIRAAFYGYADLVEVLLDADADVHATSNDGLRYLILIT